MQNSYTDRFKTFIKSLDSLKEAKSKDKNDSFVISGTIQKFSLTFDLAWKTMKDILTEKFNILDFSLGSPSEVMKKSYSNGIIEDDKWMIMLRLRNNVIHDYDETIAENSFDIIVDEYIPLFEKFKEKVNSL